MKKLTISILIFTLVFVLSACAYETWPSSTTVANESTPTPQTFENTPVQTDTNNQMESFSSDELGLCFSYPQGYSQLPDSGTLEIVAPELEGTDTRLLFWLEISDSGNRTAEEIADQEMTNTAGIDVGRSTVKLGGEQAVVLDGMPGQDLQRKVYVVHNETLYVLSFMPARSTNKATAAQLEELYAELTNSWAWSPCSASK